MASLVEWVAASFTYVTFFIVLMPLELFFIVLNVYCIVNYYWTLPLFSLGVLLMYCVYFVITMTAAHDGKGAPLRLLRESKLYKIAARYRPTRLHKTVDLPADKQYIFGVHPHSTIPTFVSVGLMTEGCEFSKIFPGIKRRGLAATPNFLIPIWREVYLWLGYIDASKKTALRAIKNGFSIFILIGGEQEMIIAKPGENILCLKNRQGFVRLAMETGSSLVPVFAFKANDCYSSVSAVRRLNKYLSKKFRIVFPIVYGYWGSPWPRQVPVDIVVGAPIPVPKQESYTPEDVNILHQKYIDSLEALYDQHKERFGCTNRELVIQDAE